MQHILKMLYISLLPKYIKLIYWGVFLHAFHTQVKLKACTLPVCVF